MYRTILFDLDGTLTDSGTGILRSLKYTFEKMSRQAPPDHILRRFVGPPLQESFALYAGMNPEEIKRALELFRERYQPIGVFENAAAPGMIELCARLKDSGCTLAVASSKPEPLCETVCRHFGFADYMTVIVGSPLEGDWKKVDILRETCRRLELSEADRAETLMVGDRKYDVEGARTCGIDCVGVEFFGYAEPGELEAAGAVAIFQTAETLGDFILASVR